MTNGRISFDIDGVNHSLYFGMVATQIVAEKSVKLVSETASNVKSFAYIVYAGLCNQAELKDESYPSFEEAYNLTEAILRHEDQDLQNNIFLAWQKSKAAKDMMERLPKPTEDKKKGESNKPKTGKK